MAIGHTLINYGTLSDGNGGALIADAVANCIDLLANMRSLEETANIVLVMQDGRIVKDIRGMA